MVDRLEYRDRNPDDEMYRKFFFHVLKILRTGVRGRGDETQSLVSMTHDSMIHFTLMHLIRHNQTSFNDVIVHGNLSPR